MIYSKISNHARMGLIFVFQPCQVLNKSHFVCLTPDLKQNPGKDTTKNPVVPRSECSLAINQTYEGDIGIVIEVFHPFLLNHSVIWR